MASSEETPLFHWQFPALNNYDSNFYNRGLILLFIFFCIIILTTTLFLYTHCVCRSRRVSSATSDHTSPEVASQASLGLDRETIDSLPIILVTTNTVEGVVIETECSICLGMFEDKEKVKVLPQCNHAYHSECVDKWLSSKSSCPLCRASLHVESTANGKSSV